MKKYIYKIEQESDPMNPRTEWDNFGRMICFHKRYNLGDPSGMKSSDFDGWDELKSYLVDECKAKVILPLYLYDHSGITIRTTPFNCNWDSGQVGFIYCTEEDMSDNGMAGKIDEERAEVLMKGEVEIYDQYLTGEVYGYRIIEETICDLGHIHENEIDSCWGYYGEEDAIAEAESIIKYYENKELKTA